MEDQLAAAGRRVDALPEAPESDPPLPEGGERLDEVAEGPAEAVELDGDGLEAEAWAYLAVRSRLGMPITFPGTTGVSAPLTGGILARA